ncbi:MAG TPA: heme-binding protein [Solirubrobacteraceae bacterium]|nr:heme-binding protein [Solirubrobacteraceae bacterium]
MTSEPPDLDHFDLDDAWRLGAALAERCRDEGLPVTISIRMGEQRVFHAALPGTSADNDSWVDRKSRVVRRFACSSLEVHDRYAQGDPDRFFATFALAASEYAPAGGAVPIRVRGTLVGVLAVSGLESTEDHELAVSALRAAKTQVESRDASPRTAGEERHRRQP